MAKPGNKLLFPLVAVVFTSPELEQNLIICRLSPRQRSFHCGVALGELALVPMHTYPVPACFQNADTRIACLLDSSVPLAGRDKFLSAHLFCYCRLKTVVRRQQPD